MTYDYTLHSHSLPAYTLSVSVRADRPDQLRAAMAATHESADYYALLGVTPNATPRDVKRAYRCKALSLHPDVKSGEGDPALFKRVQSAYRVLSDPVQRARYDAATGRAPASCVSAYYRRSFDRLFDNLFAGLWAVLKSIPPPADRSEQGRRKAG